VNLLNYLLKCSSLELWLIFLIENIAKTTRNQWLVCALTNIINTIITYWGFWLWSNKYIQIKADFNFHILVDLIVLFFAMDILMFVFHYIIHHSGLYKAIHYYHHLSVDPTPIDLFILHPLETFAFGGLWLVLLLCCPFNLWAIGLYLIVNVIFGMAGHLGIKSKSPKTNSKSILKYLGTPDFHHNHHKHINYNYGFYTNIWDRLFGTYADQLH